MNVLSVFDGISCAIVACKKLGLAVKYYASEIDNHAITVSKNNHPEIIHLGDIKSISGTDLPKIDLFIGGSPCTDLSIAKKNREGLKGSQSSLFWEYVRLKKELNPKWFILENVASMPKEDKDVITEALGVEPVLFNASLVSAQSRKRLFWTNIEFELPEDKGITLKDILQPDAEVDDRFTTKDGKSFCLTASYMKVSNSEHEVEHNAKKKQRTMVGCSVRGRLEDGKWVNKLEKRKDEKASALTSSVHSKLALVCNETGIRKLTPIECERLQGLPDDYTKSISKTNRYKAIGNAFNVDVIAHILSHI